MKASYRDRLEAVRKIAKDAQNRAAAVLLDLSNDDEIDDLRFLNFIVAAANHAEAASAAAEQALERLVETSAPPLRPEELDDESIEDILYPDGSRRH